jgi:ABC-type transport system substrate-binding protein
VRVKYIFPNLPESGPRAEILQYQWRRALDIELVLVPLELQTWLQTIFSKRYDGVADWGDAGGYLDPVWFLDQFTSFSSANGTGWADSQYDAMLASAAGVADPAERMAKLSACERYLLRGMPFLPLWTDVWPYLTKPYVKGITANLVDGSSSNTPGSTPIGGRHERTRPPELPRHELTYASRLRAGEPLLRQHRAAQTTGTYLDHHQKLRHA